MSNAEQNYFGLKESIKGKDEQVCDTERDTLIGYGKKIEQNERVSLTLKTSVSYAYKSILKLQDDVIILYRIQKVKFQISQRLK